MKNDNDIRGIHVYTSCYLLWAHKNTIFIITAFSMMIGCFYLALAKPQWTSVVFISSPELGQLSNYPEAVDLSLREQTWADKADLSTKVFNLFLANIDAYIEREKPNSPVAIFKPKVGNYRVLTFSSTNAKLAQSELTELVAFLNQQTQQNLYQSIHQSLELRKHSLQRRLNALEASTKEQEQLHIALWERAKNQRLKGGEIKQLPENISDEPLLMMEVAVFTALFELLQDTRLPFDADYFETKTALSLLSSFKLSESRFQAVNIISPPSLAKHRDSPRVPFVLGLSLLFGIVVGVTYVFIRQSWRLGRTNTVTEMAVD